MNYSASLNYKPTDNMQWRMPLAIQLVPGAIFPLLMSFQPESPRWLVEHGKFDKAARSLAFGSGAKPSDESVQYTLEEIKAEAAHWLYSIPASPKENTSLYLRKLCFSYVFAYDQNPLDVLRFIVGCDTIELDVNTVDHFAMRIPDGIVPRDVRSLLISYAETPLLSEDDADLRPLPMKNIEVITVRSFDGAGITTLVKTVSAFNRNTLRVLDIDFMCIRTSESS